MSRAVLLLVLAIGLAAVGESRGAGPAPLIAAHRGGAGLWPENSLQGFRSSLGLGVDVLELDLHLTADGEVVVIHDPTLDRTTTGAGAVRGATLAELRALRLRTREGAVTAEPVPAFAEVLGLVGAVEVMPEIKNGPERSRYDGIEEKVVALLQAHGMLARATVQAFDPETIRRVRALEPSVRTMLLVGRGRVEQARAQPSAAVGWAREAGATDLGMDHRLIDPGVVRAAREAKIRLSAWTVNEDADLRRMIDLGVDVIMTDYPDRAKQVLGR
jgi:glycerophosphoryl diester phosphodiesterase